MSILKAIITAGVCLATTCAFGHGNGRLFDIAVVDGKLIAQGYNSGSPDGLDSIRPFVNSIHDHFNFIGTETQPFGITNYPSWDIGILEGANISELIGYEITVELVGSGKWINIPEQDGTGLNQDFGVPDLMLFSHEDLEINPAEIIRVRYNGQTINTLDLGQFQLNSAVNGPTPDLDFEFFIDNQNTDEIYFVEFKLKTNAPRIKDSDTVYVIQSPDGVGPVERLHFQSLYLECYLGTAIDPVVLPGDVNLDGQLDLLDVQPFVALLDAGAFQIEADVNNDGLVNLMDVAQFVNLLATQ